MSCANCAQTVTQSLESLDGVREANVNFATDEGLVEYDTDTLTLQEIYTAIEDAGYTPEKESISIEITDMTCANCANTNEDALERIPGVISAEANFTTDTAYITYNPSSVSKEEFYRAIENAGYTPVKESEETHSKESTDTHRAEIRKQLYLTVFGILFSIPLLVFLIEKVFLNGSYFPETLIGLQFGWLEFILATPVQLILGWQFYKSSYTSLLKNKQANMDVLIALGSLTAYTYSIAVLLGVIAGGLYFDTAALILVFITLGNYLEARSKGQAGKALKKLLEMEADTARILSSDGTTKEVPVKEVQTGDLLKVKPGEKIPTDGIVINGQSAVDEAMVTGESVPVEKSEDDEVIGSTINKNGSLTIKATKIGKDTALQQIVQTVKEAQSRQPNIQNVADRISAYFVPFVILNALIWASLWFIFPHQISTIINTLPTWGLVAGGPAVVGGSVSVFEFSVIIFASAVIIACPCALGLAAPAATMVGTALGAQNGVLFKGGDILERVQKVDTVIFDKTGTLTKGELEVTEVLPTNENITEKTLLQIAASAENESDHPLAQAIVEEAKTRNIDLKTTTNFENIPGHGIKANVGEKNVIIGNRKILKENNIDLTPIENTVESLEKQGKTAVIVAINDTPAGVIANSDTIKPNAKKAISQLQQRGLDVLLITGDNKRTATAVAEKLGIPNNNVHAEVLPADKSDAVEKIQNNGNKVMMVGDGVNDAPALAVAYVGTALGSGTDVAIEAADLTLMKDNPLDVLKAIRLSEATLAKIKQNFGWALGYNTLMIPLASLGLLQPVLAAIAMSFSSISVLLNSLSFRWYNPQHPYKLLRKFRT